MELCIKTFTKNINSHRAKFFLLCSNICFWFTYIIDNILLLFKHCKHNCFYSNWIGDLVALLFVFVCSWFFIFDHSKKNSV